jgi:indole-3-glycerol phosphate synthase
LIVSILTDEELLTFHALAKSLQMDVLVEVHDEDEMDRALRINPDILGVNNRNLRTFDVSLDTTFDLMNKVADSTLLVTESGIHTQDDVTAMLEKGIYTFLVGEAFMRSKEPGLKLAELFDTDR